MAAVRTVPSSHGPALPMRLLVSIVIVEGGVQRSLWLGMDDAVGIGARNAVDPLE